MVSGSIVLQRWGRWETCIDFSFCWGKQACCSWVRVQWGRQNVLDCSSSLSLRSCDCYETPWKQLIQENPKKTLSICAFLKKNNLFALKTVHYLWVIIYLITLIKAKRAGGENFAIVSWRKLSQHHPRERWTSQSRQLYTVLVHAGRKRTSHYTMPHDSSPALAEELYKQPLWTLLGVLKLKPSQVVHCDTQDEVW